MRRMCAGLAVLAACGRLGFDRESLRDADADVDDGPADAFTICHTGTWSTPAPLAINTSSHESDPSLTADGLTMFYTSNRTTSPAYAIWTATRATVTDPFGNAMIVTELDAAGDDQDPAISPDGLTIYFDSDRGATSQIYVATRSSTALPFDAPVPLVIAGEPQPVQITPAISPDGLELYYASGALEIAYATRMTTNDLFTFERLLSEVNAPATDATPVVSADGLELFFETYRNGPAELLRSTRATKQDSWSTPVAVSELVADFPVSTSYGGPELSRDGRELYLFVNTGQIDLFVSTRTCD